MLGSMPHKDPLPAIRYVQLAERVLQDVAFLDALTQAPKPAAILDIPVVIMEDERACTVVHDMELVHVHILAWMCDGEYSISAPLFLINELLLMEFECEFSIHIPNLSEL